MHLLFELQILTKSVNDRSKSSPARHISVSRYDMGITPDEGEKLSQA